MLLYQKSAIAEDTVERITEMIRAGAYAPGDRLPGERQLAEQFSVGRTSVRAAMRRPETMGLLESRRSLGTFVKEPSHEVIQAAFIPHLISHPKTIEKFIW